ncbi:hypothetical protein [Cohnella sp. GbtcB17]|uniref:hypothetical protein n=1 Tax=Cohnella sp. GbtcB17 TaxID=2824762 RepID=UPI0020C5CA52|nr:hypothetical protein [Cohnella sp. GbtcB17]
MNVIEAAGLSKSYGKDSTLVEALKNVTFSIPQGELVAIVGASGSGPAGPSASTARVSTRCWGRSGRYSAGARSASFSNRTT